MMGNRIEGNRIYLRDVTVDDVGKDYHSWMNDPEVMQYLEARFYPRDMDDIKKYVEDVSGQEDVIFLAICLKETGRHIGNIKLGPINASHKFAYISLFIGDKDSWGQGFATEAISLVAKFAFHELKLHKVIAGCYANNSGSARAFEKAGFVKEAVEPEKWICDGEFVDGITLGFINPDWDKQDA